MPDITAEELQLRYAELGYTLTFDAPSNSWRLSKKLPMFGGVFHLDMDVRVDMDHAIALLRRKEEESRQVYVAEAKHSQIYDQIVALVGQGIVDPAAIALRLVSPPDWADSAYGISVIRASVSTILAGMDSLRGSN